MLASGGTTPGGVTSGPQTPLPEASTEGASEPDTGRQVETGVVEKNETVAGGHEGLAGGAGKSVGVVQASEAETVADKTGASERQGGEGNNSATNAAPGEDAAKKSGSGTAQGKQAGKGKAKRRPAGVFTPAKARGRLCARLCCGPLRACSSLIDVFGDLWLRVFSALHLWSAARVQIQASVREERESSFGVSILTQSHRLLPYRARQLHPLFRWRRRARARACVPVPGFRRGGLLQRACTGRGAGG